MLQQHGPAPNDGSGFQLSVESKDEARVRRIYEGLKESGSVQMPMGPTFWSRCPACVLTGSVSLDGRNARNWAGVKLAWCNLDEKIKERMLRCKSIDHWFNF